MEPQLGLIEQSFNVQYSVLVQEALGELPDNFTITDPSLPGHPIVFASFGFLKMSGYSKHEVIGKNGRMFQGPKTNRRIVMEIREAIREEKSIEITILNYRKDGTPFWMLFHMCPVFSKEDGRVLHFVGVQVPIMRKARRSGSQFLRNGVSLYEDGSGFHETMYKCCRREVCSNSVVTLSDALALDPLLSLNDKDLEVDDLCVASELEKQKAALAINNILSVLSHYSELMGRLVCRNRCCISRTVLMGASLNIALGRIKQSFVLTEPHLPDMPIVYASDSFLAMTGYSRHEVIGHNCRFLSGPGTDPCTQFQIRESIQNVRSCTVRILNYRNDGTSFWNYLHISPVRDASGKVAYFVGVQVDESCKNSDEQRLSPKMRHLSVVGSVKIACPRQIVLLRVAVVIPLSHQHQEPPYRCLRTALQPSHRGLPHMETRVAGSHFGGFREGLRACSVRMIKP